MAKVKGNLAYVEASPDGTNWTEVLGINKITPKHTGTNVDITTFCQSVVPLYKDRGTTQLDWGLNLAGFWDEADPGQALIIAGLRQMADALHETVSTMARTTCPEKWSSTPQPQHLDLATYVDAAFDMDGAGNATFGP